MKQRDGKIVLPFRIDEKSYKSLKKLSFLTEKPMAVLVREGIAMIVKDYKKVLTNSDITI